MSVETRNVSAVERREVHPIAEPIENQIPVSMESASGIAPLSGDTAMLNQVSEAVPVFASDSQWAPFDDVGVRTFLVPGRLRRRPLNLRDKAPDLRCLIRSNLPSYYAVRHMPTSYPLVSMAVKQKA